MLFCSYQTAVEITGPTTSLLPGILRVQFWLFVSMLVFCEHWFCQSENIVKFVNFLPGRGRL